MAKNRCCCKPEGRRGQDHHSRQPLVLRGGAGKKVLIVDLDPQGNTTTGYGISKRSVDIGTYEILIGEADARQAVRKTEFRTDVIGSNTASRAPA